VVIYILILGCERTGKRGVKREGEEVKRKEEMFRMCRRRLLVGF